MGYTIKPVLSGIEQKVYISENNIGSVIINIINMIDFCNRKQKEALILLVDFQKAFDSITHSFIDSTLKVQTPPRPIHISPSHLFCYIISRIWFIPGRSRYRESRNR